MPKAKAKKQTARSLEEIEQVLRVGHGKQRICGCPRDDEGPCSREYPRHAVCDFGPPVTQEELTRLRRAKHQAYLKAEFDVLADEERARAKIEWLEFELVYHEFNRQDGREKSAKSKKDRTNALRLHLRTKIKQWWKTRTKNDSENRKAIRRRKECNPRNITKTLCNSDNRSIEDTPKMEGFKYRWGNKTYRFWTLYAHVKSVIHPKVSR